MNMCEKNQFITSRNRAAKAQNSTIGRTKTAKHVSLSQWISVSAKKAWIVIMAMS